jgi:C1A family cysteine protease
MKHKLLLLLISAVLIVSILNYASALANPATVYCEEMNKEFGGYDYDIRSDEQGNQYGVCIHLNGEEYEEWQFLKGKVGKKDSYCAKKGYDIKTINENGNEYAVCVVPKSEKSLIHSSSGDFEEIPMEELMNLDEKVLARGVLQHKQSVSSNSEEGKKLVSSFLQSKSSIYNQEDYSYWDWRAPSTNTQYSSSKYTLFDDDKGWMTSIKDQGNCGSCWAFSADGSIEAKYNIEKNNSRLNPDLSEQHSVSCDTTTYLGEVQSGCDGGWMDVAMRFFVQNGTVDENCFSYTSGTGSDGICSNRCSDYQSRTWTIGDYTTTYEGSTTIISMTNNETKQWLIDYGPLAASLGVGTGTGFYDDGTGLHRCTNDNILDHGIVLVGYNDTGNDSTSYWLIKNSWGTGYDDEGYFKLGFNECGFTSEFEYAVNVTAPEFKPSITLNSPENENQTMDTLISFNFSVSNKVYQNSTCDLVLDDQEINTTSLAPNGTSTVLSYNLSNGPHTWSINCWENELGIVNNSEERSLRIGALPLDITLNSPANDSLANVDYNNFSFEVTGAYPINCTSILNSLVMNDTHDYNISGPDEGPILYSYMGLSDGDYTWSVNCTDDLSRFNETETRTFTVDTIFPLLNSTSSSPSSTSTTISYTSNESVNATIVYGTSTNLSSNSSTSSYSNSSSVSLSSLSASTLYYYNISICDRAANCVTNGTYNFTTSASGGSSSGGGGGSQTTKEYSPSNSELLSGYTQQLKKGDKIKFTFLNNQSGVHRFTLNSFSTDSAYVTIASDPMNLTLELGKEKILNISSSTYYQLSIKLNSIVNSKANITIKEIYKLIPTNSIKSIVNNTQNQTVESNKNGSIIEDPVVEKKINLLVIYRGIALIVVIIFIFLVIYIARRKNKSKNESTKTKSSRA